MSAARALRTLAPGKVNLTLEVIGRRDDGYHDLVSIVQTLDFADDLTIAPDPAGERHVRFQDPDGHPLPTPSDELIARAWQRLIDRSDRDLPARVTVRKRLPLAAGLGGGSSDAAAFLRLAARFWDLPLAPADWRTLAAGIGSDVPLFLVGGTVLIEGRGERVRPLPDAPGGWLGLLTTPELPLPAAKSRTMYSALRPRHYVDGARSRALTARLAAGLPPTRDGLLNTFDTVVAEVLLGVAPARRRLAQAAKAVPILAGAGPSLFLLADETDAARLETAAAELRAAGDQARLVRPLPRHAATHVEPLSAPDQQGPG